MAKILIAQIYAGGFCGSMEEKKATFTTNDVEKDRAGWEACEDCEGEIEELHWIFYGETVNDEHVKGPCESLFEPSWGNEGGIDAVLKKVLAAEPVIINDEETSHVIALDTGHNSRKGAMALLRKSWMSEDPEADEDGWG